jgi:hypothetical protein
MAAAGKNSPLFIAWHKQQIEVVISIELLAEFVEVIERPRIERFLRFGNAQRFLNLLEAKAIFVTPISNPPSCRDLKDEIVIATALGGQAQFIVTNDKDLLDDELLKQTLAKENLQVVYPIKLLKLLKRG